MDPTSALSANAFATVSGAGSATANAATNGGATPAPTSGNGGESGNPALQASFDKAIEQANATLEITTKNGAILYSLKQSVR